MPLPESLDQYRGAILVSAAYVLLYYCFIILQVVCTYYVYFKAKSNKKDDEKISLKKFYYDNKDPLKLTGDRAVGNTLEQMVPFLAGLWVFAVFVSASQAAQLGWVYVACRACYPLGFYLGPARLLSTIPCYIVIAMFWFGAVREAL